MRFGVVHQFGSDHHPDLASSLHGEDLVDPGVFLGDVLQPLQPLDVDLEALPARPRTAAADRVGRLGQDGLHRARLDLVVMRLNGVHDVGVLAVPTGKVGTDLGMGSLGLVGECLADVVQEGGPATHLHVQAELGREQGSDVAALDEVSQHVLPVRRPVLQGSQNGQQARGEIGDPHLDQSVLGRANAQLFHPALAALVDLFDPGGVNPSVGDQLGQCDPGRLPAHRVEARQQHAFGGVVDQHVDAGDLLEGPDVAALTADDPALHLIARQRNGRNHRLGGLFGGEPLNAGDDDPARDRVCASLRFGLDLAGQLRGVQSRVLLDVCHQLGPRVLRRKAGDGRQRLHPFGLGSDQARLAPDQVFKGLVEPMLTLGEDLLASVGGFSPHP